MVHLNCHSVYSYRKSIADVKAIALESKAQGNDFFCITDMDSITSFIKAASLTRDKKSGVYGMKFVQGIELSVRADDHVSKSWINERLKWLKKESNLKRTTAEMADMYQKEADELQKVDAVPADTVILIALNPTGLANIVDLYNIAEKVESVEELFVVDPEEILKHADGLVCILGERSRYQWLCNHGKDAEAMMQLGVLKDAFLDRLYVGLDFDTSKNVVDIAKQSNVPFAVSHDVRYIKKNERANYRLFRNIMSAEHIFSFKDHLHMLSNEEMLELSNEHVRPLLDEAEKNNLKIVQSCQGKDFPHAKPLGDDSTLLRGLCEQGWEQKRKGTKREQESRERLEYELSVINQKGFSQYFIKVLNIVNTAKDLNVLSGPARGSGGGCEVCYLLGITQVDPLEYHLYFERFLNPGRPGYPDIDLDFAAMGDADDVVKKEAVASRSRIMDKLVENGDFSFAGFIQNEVRATALVLFKNTAKYYGLPFDEAVKITGDFAERFGDKTYTGWLKGACDLFGFDWEDNWDIMEQKMPFCYQYAKIPYNHSTAASGVIMLNGETTVPVRDDTVMYNGVDLEAYGYIKYDILTITTLDMIQHFYGMDVPWNDVYDPKVWDTICRGDTDFVFQFASPGMKRLIVDSQPRNITALAECNALYRPGPMEAGFLDKYTALKQGKDPGFSNEENILKDALQDAFGQEHSGLMVFQEDVMRICQDCAGFTMTEADDIRKAMGKKNDEVLAQWAEPFVKNWNKGGDPNLVWDALKGFAKYAFNKSHSVAYAIVAYRTAHLWTYRRNEVLEYLLNDGTKENYAAAMAKCKELGFKMDYPQLDDLSNKVFHITQEGEKAVPVLHIPIECDQQYGSYVQLVCDMENSVLPLVYKGVCDRLTRDRDALANLVSSMLTKPKRQALYMEPEGDRFVTMPQILDGLKMCGAVTEWARQPDGSIDVYVTRANGRKPTYVKFHSDNSAIVKARQVKWDIKHFGTVRNGILSNLPWVEHDAISRQLQNLRDNLRQSGRGDVAYVKMRRMLEDHMREHFPTARQKVFSGVFAVLTDVHSYERSTKITLEFNNCRDIFYVSGEMADVVRAAPKNALLCLTMVYSPFVNKRREKYVYDFDIDKLTVVLPDDPEEE